MADPEVKKDNTNEPKKSAPDLSEAFTTETSPVEKPLAGGSIEWTASEYVENQKKAGWFMSVGVSAAVLSAAIYLITRDLVGIIIVVIALGLFAVTGAKKPRTLKYLIDDSGITIGDKTFPFEKFKSFALINEGGINSIQLIPLKRLQMSLNIYYPPDQEDMILKVLGSHLPAEDRKHELIDRLMRRLNF